MGRAVTVFIFNPFRGVAAPKRLKNAGLEKHSKVIIYLIIQNIQFENLVIDGVAKTY